MVSTKQLEESNIFNLILKFSGPAVVGMLVNSIYNIVDRIYIGWGVGKLGIAGITVGFPMMIINMALGMLVGIGATSLVSLRLGEKKKEEAEKVMGNAVTLLVLIALAFTTFGLLFLTPLLRLFGASEAVLPYARDYMSIILFGTAFQAVGFGVNNFIRAEGNPNRAMFTMVIGAVANIILDPVFIFVFNMGVAGAAIATVISQGISALWVFSYFLRGHSLLKFRRGNFRPELPVVKNIISIGSASFLQQITASLILTIVNNSLLKYGGDIAVSAMGIVHSAVTLMFMPVIGISQGVQPIIGYNYGARRYERVQKALLQGSVIATGIVMVGYLLVIIAPEMFTRLFTSDAELIAVASKGLRFHLVAMPLLGFQIVGANYFQAVGKPRHTVFLNLCRQAILIIPALLILPRYLGLNGVWLAHPVADVGSTILTGTLIFLEYGDLAKRAQAPASEQVTEKTSAFYQDPGKEPLF